MKALLQHWVTDQAERRPDAVALVMRHESLTYRELEESSNRLARLLKERHCKRGDRICLLVPKSPAAIVGILGILKADCTYVPLDTSSPASRLAKIIESCEPRCILVFEPADDVLDEAMANEKFRASTCIGWMGSGRIERASFKPEFSLDDLPSYPSHTLDCQNSEHDPAHILFTSGSTGIPKGVIITHTSVIHFIEWAVRYFGTSPSDRISGHPPLHFDLSTFDMFGTFAVGAQLHLVPPQLNLLPNKMADFIRSSKLTQWFSVPSALNYMAKLNVVGFNDFPALKRILWCGEVFPTPALIHWMKRLPGVTFTNLYGPTEATIASSYYTIPRCPEREDIPIPIGKACADEELLVLDDKLRPAPAGEVGDLFIRGVGLSPGYWRDPDKSSAVFLPNPLSSDPNDRIYKTGDLAKVADNGLVYFLGRADSQIKSRGYRIELGEIETALNALGLLKDCAVVGVNTGGFEGTIICCAYVPLSASDCSPVVLRKALNKVLPAYMVPSRWRCLDRLPQNCNGKTDRLNLRARFLQDSQASAS